MSVSRPIDVPGAPGVYEFVDRSGRVLYVGKAKDLSRRVASYFRSDVAPRTALLVQRATSLRWVVCASEAEALVLEREWIRSKQPPFNIRLRAGAGYSGVHVSADQVVRLASWRGARPRRGTSFGPYPGVATADLVDALQIVFGVRTCDDATYRKAELTGRPCLLGETGKCLAPCVGRVSVEAHNAAAGALTAHLRQPDPRIGERLDAEMRALADGEHFEAASRRRDQLKALEVIGRRQRVLGGAGWDRVAVACRRNGERMAVACTRVLDGAVTLVETYVSADDPMLDEQETLTAVLAELALPAGAIVITAQATSSSRRARGERERGLLAFTSTQAQVACEADAPTPSVDPAEQAQALARLAELLRVAGPLRRVECMDVSHTQGRHTVGSVVTLCDGVAHREEFRAVHLRDVGGDDYAAMRELVQRRTSGRRLGLDALPDLLLIDGGPGQVAAALDALLGSGLVPANHDDAPGLVAAGTHTIGPVLAGLAKRFEELWPVGAERPVLLGMRDPVLRTLTAARDHAHHHALGASRRRRERAALRTGLDDVVGVGPTRKRALLARFGTLDAIARAPLAELAAVAGIGPGLAQRIHDHFHGATPVAANVEQVGDQTGNGPVNR